MHKKTLQKIQPKHYKRFKMAPVFSLLSNRQPVNTFAPKVPKLAKLLDVNRKYCCFESAVTDSLVLI